MATPEKHVNPNPKASTPEATAPLKPPGLLVIDFDLVIALVHTGSTNGMLWARHSDHHSSKENIERNIRHLQEFRTLVSDWIKQGGYIAIASKTSSEKIYPDFFNPYRKANVPVTTELSHRADLATLYATHMQNNPAHGLTGKDLILKYSDAVFGADANPFRTPPQGIIIGKQTTGQFGLPGEDKEVDDKELHIQAILTELAAKKIRISPDQIRLIDDGRPNIRSAEEKGYRIAHVNVPIYVNGQPHEGENLWAASSEIFKYQDKWAPDYDITNIINDAKNNEFAARALIQSTKLMRKLASSENGSKDLREIITKYSNSMYFCQYLGVVLSEFPIISDNFAFSKMLEDKEFRDAMDSSPTIKNWLKENEAKQLYNALISRIISSDDISEVRRVIINNVHNNYFCHKFVEVMPTLSGNKAFSELLKDKNLCDALDSSNAIKEIFPENEGKQFYNALIARVASSQNVSEIRQIITNNIHNEYFCYYLAKVLPAFSGNKSFTDLLKDDNFFEALDSSSAIKKYLLDNEARQLYDKLIDKVRTSQDVSQIHKIIINNINDTYFCSRLAEILPTFSGEKAFDKLLENVDFLRAVDSSTDLKNRLGSQRVAIGQFHNALINRIKSTTNVAEVLQIIRNNDSDVVFHSYLARVLITLNGDKAFAKLVENEEFCKIVYSSATLNESLSQTQISQLETAMLKHEFNNANASPARKKEIATMLVGRYEGQIRVGNDYNANSTLEHEEFKKWAIIVLENGNPAYALVLAKLIFEKKGYPEKSPLQSIVESAEIFLKIYQTDDDKIKSETTKYLLDNPACQGLLNRNENLKITALKYEYDTAKTEEEKAAIATLLASHYHGHIRIGNEFKKDNTLAHEGFQSWAIKALSNNPVYAYNLAYCIHNGFGYPQDIQKSADIFWEVFSKTNDARAKEKIREYLLDPSNINLLTANEKLKIAVLTYAYEIAKQEKEKGEFAIRIADHYRMKFPNLTTAAQTEDFTEFKRWATTALRVHKDPRNAYILAKLLQHQSADNPILLAESARIFLEIYNTNYPSIIQEMTQYLNNANQQKLLNLNQELKNQVMKHSPYVCSLTNGPQTIASGSGVTLSEAMNKMSNVLQTNAIKPTCIVTERGNNISNSCQIELRASATEMTINIRGGNFRLNKIALESFIQSAHLSWPLNLAIKDYTQLTGTEKDEFRRALFEVPPAETHAVLGQQSAESIKQLNAAIKENDRTTALQSRGDYFTFSALKSEINNRVVLLNHLDKEKSRINTKLVEAKWSLLSPKSDPSDDDKTKAIRELSNTLNKLEKDIIMGKILRIEDINNALISPLGNAIEKSKKKSPIGRSVVANKLKEELEYLSQPVPKPASPASGSAPASRKT